MAIVCDKCIKNRVSKDGDICDICKEKLREKDLLDYLEGYLYVLEDWDTYRITVDEGYLKGLKHQIELAQDLREFINKNEKMQYM